MERHSFHNDFQQIKQFKSKELVGIIRVGFAKEELKESPFVTKTNGLLLDMKMNVRFFDLSVNSIQYMDYEGQENNYSLIGIDIIKDR